MENSTPDMCERCRSWHCYCNTEQAFVPAHIKANMRQYDKYIKTVQGGKTEQVRNTILFRPEE